MDNDADDHHLERERVLCGGGERYDDAIHEEVDGDAVERAGENGVLKEKGKPAACEIEDDAGGEGDEEVAQKAESCGGEAAVVAARAKDAGGDSLEEADGFEAEGAVDQESCADVQDAADKAAGEDGEEGAGLRCCGGIHAFLPDESIGRPAKDYVCRALCLSLWCV